ncbi:PAS domain-containing protein [Aureispira anguillae]|uniref:PAS domain-containing protein n=1 Tax=Aureispira anguillae TaxID=2864201 RepID=A0A915YBK9_9BACT|nr:PAS domain-containing protein [Aureispira anguillae]BDS10082.1 PAS domain-containing protein [Aureispira anguillae]
MKEDFLNQNYKDKDTDGAFKRVFDLSPDAMLKIRTADFRLIAANQQACHLYGYTNSEFGASEINDLGLDEMVLQKIIEVSSDYAIGQIIELEGVSKQKNGTLFPVQIRYCKTDEKYALAVIRRLSTSQEIKTVNANFSKVLALKEQQNKKLQLNRDILRLVTQHQPLPDVLDAMAQRLEDLVEGMKVAILLLEGAQLFVGAAPTLPKKFLDALDGIHVGPYSVPCAHAVYFKKQIIIENIETDPTCMNCRDFCLMHDVRACWSTPIISSEGLVLGTFAMCWAEPQKTTTETLDLITMAINLAEIAIEQSYYQESLTAINEEYILQNKELELAKLQLEEDKKIVLDREHKLKEGQRLSKVGSWEFNFKTRELIWSEEQYRIYELTGIASVELYDAYQARIHPEDREIKKTAYRNSINGSKRFNYEHRIVTGDGQTKYILGVGKLETNDSGEPLFLKGTDQDVTELKLAQQAAWENEFKLNELMSNINEIVFIVDLRDSTQYDNPITYINGDTVEIFGYTHQELKDIVNLWVDRIHPEDLQSVIEKSEILHQYKRQVTREYRFKHKKGHYLWIEDNISIGGNDDKYSKLYGSARDITKRKKSEAALLESKERLQLATQAAKLGSYDWRVKENYIHWDDRMYEIFGLDRKPEIKDKRSYVMSVMHPDDRERINKAFAKNLVSSDVLINFKNEYRIVLNEKNRYIESYVIFFRDRKGRVDRVIGTCLDVTERKEAEALLISNEEKDVLLKEIHHRVKNNLQVITSLLSLQSSYLASNEQRKLFTDSQYRINSMAMVHEMLYQSDNLSKVDYQDYLSELSQFLIRSVKGSSNNIHLILDVPKMSLGIDTAIPLGLLINEVLTNSLKYGVQGNDKGTISIKIRRKINDKSEKPSFVLEIGDDGAGYPDTINFRNSNSLGLKLIHNLTRQLEGTLEKDNTRKGTNYIICFNEI